jgi:hypothetical protein
MRGDAGIGGMSDPLAARYTIVLGAVSLGLVAALPLSLWRGVPVTVDPVFTSRALVGAFPILLGVARDRRLVLATVAAGLALTAVLGVPLLGAAFGVPSLAALAWLARRRRDSPTMEALLAACLWPAFSAITGACLQQTPALGARTLDQYVWAADAALGAQPSFALGARLASHPVVLEVLSQVYNYLPLSLAIGFAAERRARRPADLLTAALAAGVLGYGIYLLFPVVGPAYVVPAFPLLPADGAGALRPAADAYRNGMPSLHFGWSLLILRHCWRCGRAARWFALVNAALVAAATLAFGLHYLMDLVVAVPFVEAVEALVPGVGGPAARRLGFGAGALGTAALLLAIRCQWIASMPMMLAAMAIALAPPLLVFLLGLRIRSLASGAAAMVGADAAAPAALRSDQ